MTGIASKVTSQAGRPGAGGAGDKVRHDAKKMEDAAVWLEGRADLVTRLGAKLALADVGTIPTVCVVDEGVVQGAGFGAPGWAEAARLQGTHRQVAQASGGYAKTLAENLTAAAAAVRAAVGNNIEADQSSARLATGLDGQLPATTAGPTTSGRAAAGVPFPA